MSRLPRKIGTLDRVTVSTDGPDVLLQVPGNPCCAHWTDFKQIADGLYLAIKQARDFEAAQKKSNGGGH